MQVFEIISLFDNGVIKHATILPCALRDGYYIDFELKKGDNETLTTTRDKDEPRHFSSVDSAIKVLLRIGFKNVHVILPRNEAKLRDISSFGLTRDCLR